MWKKAQGHRRNCRSTRGRWRVELVEEIKRKGWKEARKKSETTSRKRILDVAVVFVLTSLWQLVKLAIAATR